MELAKKALMFAAAVAIASVLALAVAPRAAHAVAAILVTVTNTEANPVPTADLFRSAAQNVELFCTGRSGVVSGVSCGQVNPQTGPPLPGVQYTVPAGQNLVITTIDFDVVNPAPGITTNALATLDPKTLNYQIREYLAVPNNVTTQFSFPGAGIVIPAGLQHLVAINSGPFVVIRGYLTPN